jgi:tetratricopeptide (TPR) repeat protein
MTPTEPPPLFSLALAVLRSLQGWSQKRLSQESGIPSSLISAYETGVKNLSRPRLDTLAAHLGFAPWDVEEILSFLSWFRPASPRSVPVGLSPEDVREIELSATTVARVAAENARAHLTRRLQAARADEARQQAEEAWKILKPLSARKRLLIVEHVPAFQTWAVCERLCAESIRIASADARRAVEVAELALRVARLVPGEEGWRNRLQGYAWAYLGNARRIASHLPAADEAFARAWDLWSAGAEADPGWLQEERLLSLEASLRRDQRRFPDALRLLDRALALANTEAEVSSVFSSQAATLELMGEHKLALEAIEKAIPFVNRKHEPRLFWVLLFNRAVALCHLGQYSEASELLPTVRQMAIELRNGLDLIRVRWLEGKVARSRGRRMDAIAALRQVRAEFTAQNLAYDSALSTLELASLYLEEGRTGEVKTLAREMAPIFKAQGVHEEALAALKLFREAVERETVTPELANRLVDYLERARYDPDLRFAA